MTGLGDLLGGADEASGRAVGGAELGNEPRGAVHTRVRRAHARRSALRASIVAVAVVVLGTAGIYGVTRVGETSMADQGAPSSPSASPSVTPSATPSPTQSAAFPFSREVTEDAHLPQASALTPEVWASVEPGWSLVSYREAWNGGAGPQVVYLASPVGVLYQLVELEHMTVEVLAWNAGDDTARVTVMPDDGVDLGASLDLATGHMVAIDGYAPYADSLAFLDADGAPVWRGNDSTAAFLSITASGSLVPFAIPASDGAAEFAKAKTGLVDCGVSAPYDDSTALVQCWDGDGRPAVVMASESDGVAKRLGEIPASSPTRAGDFVVAATGEEGADGCPSQYTVISGDSADAVPGWDSTLHPEATIFMPFGATGNVLVWGATSGCSSDVSPVAVVRSDLARGEGTVLVPYPYDRPSGEEPYQSVTGVAVGR